MVTTDFIAALNQRKLSAAGLDVTDTEQLPADSPLWQMKNILITPHIQVFIKNMLKMLYKFPKKTWRNTGKMEQCEKQTRFDSRILTASVSSSHK